MDEFSDNTVNPWFNRLYRIMNRAVGMPLAKAIAPTYRHQFTEDYQRLLSPRYGLNDLLHLSRLVASGQEQISLVKPYADQPYYRIHFYSLQEHYLDEFIPILENVNLRVLDQVQFAFTVEGKTASIKSFTVQPAKFEFRPLRFLQARLLEAVQMMMQNRLEIDPLNKLVVLSGMAWQDVEVLRTYRNYLLQIDRKTSSASIHHAFLSNPNVALDLYHYFETRFRPAPLWEDPMDREELALFPLRTQLSANLDLVADINDDRILRTVFNLIDATVRTNFHLRRDQPDFFIAIKINSLGILEMPSPRPLCEIYVHAAEMEGIHLRAGKISRGGIRWSDRVDDFRTEILDLMQTQVSKNALIIPTGAKGGFVIKKRNGTPAAFGKAGQEAYSKLIQGLLELTDNHHGNVVSSPDGVVTHDDPDPYLVVAADKGTARFSDIANAIATKNGYWLADAFASGGSHGYDHKALGITARGAWLCVRRHFMEMGKEIQDAAFSVIGIGSMDGDVFGNGMLLSPYIRLKAAFSGQHIFIDPNPGDNDLSLKERKRLFESPGSTWDDYDRNLISAGGGVFSRVAKDIPISAEMKAWLGIRYNFLDGDSLIRLLLQAPVELLWLGGIGTYVKASTEKPEEVDDKSNENVRINASQLQAKVVGEGANLGFTQQARIEYALSGGRINTDAVDNSAGVDTSDHEVNLKILLGLLEKKKLVANTQALFDEMTDAICQLVLKDNLDQSLCLSLEQRRCAVDPVLFLRVADRLEATGFLDRDVEAMPHNKEIQLRLGQCITRPELAVLMAASKRYLTHHLHENEALLQGECYHRYLYDYFPAEITNLYQDDLSSHPLANQIKTTFISNRIINQAGSSFLDVELTNSNAALLQVVNCYLAYDLVLDGELLRQQISAMEVTADRQHDLLLILENALKEFSRESLKHGLNLRPDDSTIELYRNYLGQYQGYYHDHGGGQVEHFLSSPSAVPTESESSLHLIEQSQDFPFVVSLAVATGEDFTQVIETLDEINRTLALGEIRSGLLEVVLRDEWEQKITENLLDDIKRVSGFLLKQILASETKNVAGYLALRAEALSRFRKLFLEVQNTATGSLLPYVVLVRSLAGLVEAREPVSG